MNSTLVAFGWSEWHAARLQEVAPSPELWLGRVVGQHRREWDIRSEVACVRAALAGRRWGEGRFDTLEIQPVAGDWVLCRGELDAGGPPVVEQVLPRRTLLARGAAGRNGKGQVVAANMDYVAVVGAFTEDKARESVQRRSLNPRRMERYLTAIQSGGAQPIILLNKADLSLRAAEIKAELEARLPRVPILLVSTKSGLGKEELEGLVGPRQTIGFVGLSGVGKSSIVNLLLGQNALLTQAERERDGRGRHTTTHRELFLTPKGALVIDTPGMREFSLNEADEEDLSAFADIDSWAQECRFADCRHAGEPGCRVEKAVADGELVPDRLDNFRALRDEMADRRRSSREKRIRAPLKPRPKGA